MRCHARRQRLVAPGSRPACWRRDTATLQRGRPRTTVSSGCCTAPNFVCTASLTVSKMCSYRLKALMKPLLLRTPLPFETVHQRLREKGERPAADVGHLLLATRHDDDAPLAGAQQGGRGVLAGLLVASISALPPGSARCCPSGRR